MTPDIERILPMDTSDNPKPMSFDMQKRGKASSMHVTTNEKIQYTRRCRRVFLRFHNDATVAGGATVLGPSSINNDGLSWFFLSFSWQTNQRNIMLQMNHYFATLPV